MVEQNQVETCLDYTLKVLLGEEADRLSEREHIAYSEPVAQTGTSVRLYIVPSGFFDNHYGKPDSLPTLPLKEIEGVPLLYGSPIIRRQGDMLIIHADIIASTYFLVTRYEEVVRRDVRDRHGRFPGRESLPCRAGFIDRPIVEEYAALLRKWLRQIGVDLPEPKRNFSILLTHDVDALHKYQHPFQVIRTALSAMLGRQPLQNIPVSLAVILGLKKDPYDTFDELILLAASFKNRSDCPPIESVYFFMACPRSSFDPGYDIRSETARKAIRKVSESGAKVGLHTSYQAGIYPELIAEEKALLEEVCGFPIRHNRHHFLGWRNVEDGWALAKAGIDWDSTLGYPDVAGFRLGICHPIQLFDPIKMRPLGIEEHPLIVMDCTLSSPDYMALNEEKAFEYCRQLINQTRKHNGEFVMLWHNTMFAPEPSNYHPRLYRRLLSQLSGLSRENEDVVEV